MNKISKYLLWSSFVGTFAEQMITPIYAMFVGKIGGSLLDAGIGYAIFSILTGLIIILTGKIKWFNENLELLVFLGFTIASVGDFCYFFVHDTFGLFLVQATNGLSVGLLNPAWEALYTKDGEDGKEHESWSMWGGGVNISTGIAALVGAAVATIFSFKAMFVLTAAINSIAIYYAYLIYKKPKHGPESQK
jgi:predicted MFS family arabinose efflux permease